MTQRKAVVPIKSSFVHHGVEIATLRLTGDILTDSFKLTKADVENAAKAFHDGELGGDDHDFDDPENASSREWCIAVVKQIVGSLGIEVEE